MAQFNYDPSTGIPLGNGTDDWTELDRPFELKTRRATGAQPGAIEVVIPGTSSSDKDDPPVWIFQRVMLEDFDVPSLDQRRMFIGRVDSVSPRQDPTYGRVWVIKARDYLAALSDNFVDIGKNRAYRGGGPGPGPATQPGATTGKLWSPKWVERSQMSGQDTPLPAEECDNVGERCGAYREVIAAELALNIVPLPFGIFDVGFPSEFRVNSLPVQYNLEDVRSRRILDAITDIAGEDPWTDAGGAKVDSRTADGIGAEFQVKYSDSSPWLGQRAQYFKRGAFLWDSSVTFAYGETGASIRSIIGYDFPQEGHDVFSRAKAVGKGEAQDIDPKAEGQTAGWGTGLILSSPQVEGSWKPEDGEFAVMRGTEEQESGLIGDLRFDPADVGATDPNPLKARAMRDRATSKMLAFSTSSTLQLQGRGLRGMIRVAGYPRKADLSSLIIGTLIQVRIPQVFGDLGSNFFTFVVESWEFKYPENTTTIQLALRATATMRQIFGGWERRQDQSWGSHGDWKDSKWKISSGNGIEKFTHNMGVPPRTIIVEVAARDGNKTDREGKPLPVETSITEVPRLANEPAQGQNFGYVVHRSDIFEFEYGLAYWIADSEGAGDWLRDGLALVRVRVRP